MEMRHLRYFLAVAEHGTLTAAAVSLGVAQPAISQSISRLEADLGTRLFNRTRRGAELTPAGLAFREDVIDGFGILENAAQRARERERGKIGRLTIGVGTSALCAILPDAIALLRQNFPRIEVVLKEMSNLEQAEALRASVIDIGLLHPPFPLSSWLKERTLREDELIAVVPNDFPVPAGQKVAFRNLCHHSLITFPESMLPDLRAGLRMAYREAGHPMRISQEVSHTLTALSCVASGCGIALLAKSVEPLTFRDVRYLEISDADALPKITTNMVWRATTKPSTADHLVELLRAKDGQLSR